MIRFILDVILIVGCFVMQQTLFQALSLGGIVPNILLILTSVYGFISGRREGMWIGFISGILIDIFFGGMIGINALIYMFVGYFNGYYKGGFFHEDLKVPMLLIIASDFAYSVIYYVINFLLRGRNNIYLYTKSVVIPELFYTLLVALIIYRPLLFLLEKTNFDDE